MNTIRDIQQINERELSLGIAGTSASWHAQYPHSAWVYVGNLSRDLSEGDILCFMSQYGEIEDLYLCRNEESKQQNEGATAQVAGESKGFGFVKYEDARSCILAVDNLIGSMIAGRSLRVEHVEKYRLPKHLAEKEEEARVKPGQAYEDIELEENGYTLEQGQDLFAPATVPKKKSAKEERKEAKRKRKEERKRKRKDKERKRQKHRRQHGGVRSVSSSSSEEEDRERQKRQRRERRPRRSRSRS